MNTNVYPETYLIANNLDGLSDVEFAEVFAAYYKIHFKGKKDGIIVQDDMDFNIRELTNHLEKYLNEIIYSEEMDMTAWWKDDKFFGRDTPKARFLSQTAEFQSRRLMETAMTMNNTYRNMLKEGKVDDCGIQADVYEVICTLAKEFEETFFETDEYENDYVAVIEKWFPERFLEEIN
jgi:hypothetical protein